MNVETLLFASKNGLSGKNQSSGQATQRQDQSTGAFEAVLNRAMSARPRQAPAPQSQAKAATPAKTIPVKGKTREQVKREVADFLAQATAAGQQAPPVQAPPREPGPSPAAPTAQAPEAPASTATVTITVTASDEAEARQVAQAMGEALKEMGYSEEEISQMVQVVAQQEAAVNAPMAQPAVVVQDAEPGQNPGGESQQVTVTLSVRQVPAQSEAPSPQADQSQGARRQEAPQPVAAQVPPAQEAPETTAAPQPGAGTPVAHASAPAPAQVAPSQQQAQPPAPSTAQAEVVMTPQEPKFQTVGETPTQPNTPQASVAAASETAQPQTPANPPVAHTAPEAMMALAELVSALAQDGQEVTVSVRRVNQDQTASLEHQEAATEEERVVVQPDLEQDGAQAEEAAQVRPAPAPQAKAQAQETAASTPVPVQPGPLAQVQAAAQPGAALTPVKEEGSGVKAAEETDSKRDLSEVSAPIAPAVQKAPAPAQKAYGQAFARLVSLGSVSALLRDMSSQDTTVPPPSSREADPAQATAKANEAFHRIFGEEAPTVGPQAGVPATGSREGVTPRTGGALELGGDTVQARIEFAQKVSQRVAMLAATGAAHHEVRLSVKPDHLGDIRMTVETVEGVVKATFIVESQRVQEILQSGFNALRQELAQAGLKLDHTSVSVRQDAQGQEGQPAFGQGAGRQGQGRPGRYGGQEGGGAGAFAHAAPVSFDTGSGEPAVNYLV